MIPFFPKQIASKGVLVYFIALATVCFFFFRHLMPLVFVALGVMWVAGFFFLSASCSKSWARLSEASFVRAVFWTALGLRVAWVVFSYYFYTSQTGQPFEFDAADSYEYHDLALWWASMSWKQMFQFIDISQGVSDIGYPFYLSLLYRIIGPSVMGARLVKAMLGSFTCVLLYRLAERNFGLTTGRMAAIFAVFMPNLIIYCGLHCKEIEMITLIVAFLERADFIIRSHKFSIVNVAVTLLLAASLFFFRTVIGAVAILSLMAGLIFTSTNYTRRMRNLLVGVFCAAVLATVVGGTIAMEIEENWDARVENEVRKREHQVRDNGAAWANYATGAVMAPMVVVLPFSTMVDTDQGNQMVMHGGNFVRNFMGFFVILALFYALFKEKTWRNFTLLGAFVAGYLGIISVSGYANSERFLLPALPGLLAMAAYGVSKLNAKSYGLMKYWLIVVVLMEVGWAYFKLGSRGLF